MEARRHGAGWRVGLLFILFSCATAHGLDFNHELRNQEADFIQILPTIGHKPTVTKKHPSKHLRMVATKKPKRRHHRA